MDATILLVEDDPDFREVLVEILEDRGLRTIVAPHGNAALHVLHEGLRPSVIVLDLMMPVLDGWELVRRLAADPALAQLPVIVLTAHPEAMRVGGQIAAVVGKPLVLRRLLSAITAVIESNLETAAEVSGSSRRSAASGSPSGRPRPDSEH